MTTDALGYSEDNIVLNPENSEGDIADLVLGLKGLSVDVMSINSASLKRHGERFVASVDIYDGEVHEVEVTREQVLKVLSWDNI